MTAEENILTIALSIYKKCIDHKMATSQLRQLDSDMVHVHVCIVIVRNGSVEASRQRSSPYTLCTQPPKYHMFYAFTSLHIPSPFRWY